jgi:endoglucanase
MPMKIVFAAFLLFVAPAQADAIRNACVPGAQSGVPSARLNVLARGFNLTGWLDSDVPRRPDLATLATLSTRGLTHVRLPVKAELLMEDFSSRVAVGAQLGELDSALRALLTLGYGVSLDVHPGGKLGLLHRNDPNEGFGRIRALWLMLARRYRDQSPDRLFLEVLNEPTVPEDIWNSQGPRLAQLIRQEAPQHTIIYGPANYQQIAALSQMQPLGDPNVVYAVHYYEPMIFTHQGLNWSEDPLRHLHDVPFPAALSDRRVVQLIDNLGRDGRAEAAELLRSQLRAPWNKDRVRDVIARAGSWAQRHGKPVLLNEFGVLAWKAPAHDRVQWLEAVRRAAEMHCIGWTHWDYADGFGFVRRADGREVPDEPVLDALLNTRRP